MPERDPETDLLRRRLKDPAFAESYRDYLAIVTARARPHRRDVKLPPSKLIRPRRGTRAR